MRGNNNKRFSIVVQKIKFRGILLWQKYTVSLIWKQSAKLVLRRWLKLLVISLDLSLPVCYNGMSYTTSHWPSELMRNFRCGRVSRNVLRVNFCSLSLTEYKSWLIVHSASQRRKNIKACIHRVGLKCVCS